MRVVSLCPSLSETLVEIGVVPVGVTRYCLRPRETTKEIPKIGGTKNPDLDRIRSLEPDLVVANAEENRAEDLAALAKNFRVHVSLPRRVADVPAVLRELGAAVERSEEADRLAREIEERTASPLPAPAFKFVYFIWKGPWMSVSADTYVSDLFRYAGGANAFATEAARYPEVTPAAVAAAAPDVLIFPSEPFPFSEGHRTEIEAAFGRSAPAFFVDGDDCCWHGVRTRQGLHLMTEIGCRIGRLPRR